MATVCVQNGGLTRWEFLASHHGRAKDLRDSSAGRQTDQDRAARGKVHVRQQKKAGGARISGDAAAYVATLERNLGHEVDGAPSGDASLARGRHRLGAGL